MLVRSDANNKTRLIGHVQDPYHPDGLAIPTNSILAENYLNAVSSIYEIESKKLADLHLSPLNNPDSALKEQLRLTLEKKVMGTSVIEYTQTYYGLPIWEAGVAISIHDSPKRVSSSVSTIHYNINIDEPNIKEILNAGKTISVDFLCKSCGLSDKLLKEYAKNRDEIGHHENSMPIINNKRLIIYRYDPALRFDPASTNDHSNSPKNEDKLHTTPPILPLKTVPSSILPNKHYVVHEVMFSYTLPVWGELNWRAFIEPITGAVLYLRALVSGVDGFVFEIDPLSQSGNVAVTSGSNNATLNPLRTSVSLQGLTAPAPGDDQELTGEYVELQELVNPVVAAPEETVGTNFNYDATTDNFTAVNAYHHCDGVFRMIAGMGFNMATYFDGTTFPVPVDHRGTNNQVNAFASINGTGNGTGRLRFGLVNAADPIGITADRRVVLHEFGHVLLYDHVNDGSFRFAHSAGDSLAAILSDPDSNAPDRFLSFPFVTAGRRHDRAIGSGWAWGGTNDDRNYGSEQILATTLFRAYRSTGGDDTRAAVQNFASEYMAYLIIGSIGTLTPATNPNNPEAYATALINADMGTTDYKGHPGGAFHKVIRWAFEKQGAYQPAGAANPVVTEGAAPNVDIYINDGRDGEYAYQPIFWKTTDIWNRLASDSLLAHQTPILNRTNYVYVKIKNKGTQQANNIVVKGHHRKPGAGLVWPNDWKSMTTVSINAGNLAAGAEKIVGPFEWTPAVEGHECLLMIVEADGDQSNVNNLNAGQSIPHWRLVPFDNNIAQRNVAPIPGGGGFQSLLDAMKDKIFYIKNPFKAVSQLSLEYELPEVLIKKGWKLQFKNMVSDHLSLAPFEEREVMFELLAGDNFSAEELNGTQEVNITLLANQLPVGGMTYAIDPKMINPAIETLKEENNGKGKCSKITANQLLKCLDLDIDSDKIKKVCIKKITIDIELDNDCC
ncbi:MAG: hypothetical protein JKY48_10620 [Flavobacteriales bacterium]|nr:hypothetical protein [Flavobacteriales bacterium]